MDKRKNTKKMSWAISILALIVFLDLFALTWYFWTIPEEHFNNLKKILSTLATWLGTIFTYFGIRYKFKKKQSLEQVLRIRPVQLCIIAFTILIWFFVLPFHSISISIYQFDTEVPLSGVIVKVDQEKGQRPTSSNSEGKIKIKGLQAAPHKLSFDLNGYKTKDISIGFAEVISPWGSSRVELEKAEGTIKFETTPEGAAIFLDGENNSIGITPKIYTLSIGKHRVKFKKKRFHPIPWEELQIEAGENPPFKRKLEMIASRTYSLTVSSDPEGAQIYINDRLGGITPTTVRLPRGNHRIEIKMDGYISKKDVVRVPEQKIITYDLERQ